MIITPFLRANKRIRELLEDKDRMKIDIRVVYGKTELQPAETKWLDSMTFVRTSFCKNLHAKCYLNEKQALLTSMNLYEFSQVNNHEMGLLVVRNDEEELYNEILQESMRIVRISEEIGVTAARVDTTKNVKQDTGGTKTRRKSRSTRRKQKNGFCIRCKEVLPADPGKPYCKGCYRIWNRYKNEEYKEKYCHMCGSKYQTALLKPMCRTCRKKYKDGLKSPTKQRALRLLRPRG